VTKSNIGLDLRPPEPGADHRHRDAEHTERVNAEGASQIELSEQSQSGCLGPLRRQHQDETGMYEKYQDSHLPKVPHRQAFAVTEPDIVQMSKEYRKNRDCTDQIQVAAVGAKRGNRLRAGSYNLAS
jgi:hypothetical protein